MPKVPKDYVKKKFTHRSILVSLPSDLLDLIATLIPNYRRSKLITELLQKYCLEHGQDPVLAPQIPKQKNNAKKIKCLKKK